MSIQPEPSSHPVARAKAPWPLKAESYMMFLRMKELPKGVYDQLEEVWGSEEFGKFEGGLGAIVIVRYSDTPVGPYDELILVPGTFTVPAPSTSTPFQIPKKALRIARIYVSQRTTTYNGRLNWNIPKHLARFEFSAPTTTTSSTSSPPESLKVRVYPPGTAENDGTPPFFACTLTPWRWVPRIPLNTAYVPMSLMLAQPPCPEAPGRRAAVEAEAQLSSPIDAYDISHKTEEAVLVGTERWCAIEVKAKMGARGCWVEMGKENGDDAGRYWPKGVEPWVSVGAWMEDGVFEFGEPLEWKL